MKLTQELIGKIQEAMLHTNLKGEINWKDGDDIEVQIAGTFAKDKFIVLKNASKNPFENAQPHPHFDYEKKVFTKDGRFLSTTFSKYLLLIIKVRMWLSRYYWIFCFVFDNNKSISSKCPC